MAAETVRFNKIATDGYIIPFPNACYINVLQGTQLHVKAFGSNKSTVVSSPVSF
jgi:hypothetical protein